jgi:hypothetical protein
MSDENPQVRIPENEEGVHEIAEEADEENLTKEQREALAKIQAEIVGDL